MTRPVLSVVDYDAWEKGYMPPSEHVLIDKLSYRGARVVMSTWLGGDQQLWVVLEGDKPLTQKQRRLMLEMMKIWFDDDEPAQPEHPRDVTVLPEDGADGERHPGDIASKEYADAIGHAPSCRCEYCMPPKPEPRT